MDIASLGFNSVSQSLPYTSSTLKAASPEFQPKQFEKPIMLFRKQNFGDWVVVQREPSGEVKGFRQKYGQALHSLTIKGLLSCSNLNLEHVENAKKLFNENIQIFDHYIEIVPALKGGMQSNKEPEAKGTKQAFDQMIREKREVLGSIQSAIELQENYVGTQDIQESLRWYKKILQGSVYGFQGSLEIHDMNSSQWFSDKIKTTFQKLFFNHQSLNSNYQLLRCFNRAVRYLDSDYPSQMKTDALNGIVWEISKIFKALTKEITQMKEELKECESQVILYKAHLMPAPTDTQATLHYYQRIFENSIRIFELGTRTFRINSINKSKSLVEETLNALLRHPGLNLNNDTRFSNSAKQSLECLRSQCSTQEKFNLLNATNVEISKARQNYLDA